MSLEKTKQWFEQAIPEPKVEDCCIQIGCAYEETLELARTMGETEELITPLEFVSDRYKHKSSLYLAYLSEMSKEEKVQMLDDIVDEIVTRIGVGHCMGFDILGALEEINRSNFSKFEDGKPVFDVNGKITKGKNYVKPSLEKFV